MAQMTRDTQSRSLPREKVLHSYHQERLKIRGFYLRLTGTEGFKLPSNLTLVYLPRIDGISAMEVNGCKVGKGTPGIVSLDRVLRSDEPGAVFANTDRVRAGDCARFEAYLGDQKVVNGVFRRGGDGWKIECRCTAREAPAESCEVCVVEESGVVMKEKIDISKTVRKRKGFCSCLEEIPEESECCACGCCQGGEEEDEGLDGGRNKDELFGDDDDDDKVMMEGWDEEIEMKKVGWAVDVGLWVACLGVGLMVSKASFRHFF